MIKVNREYFNSDIFVGMQKTFRAPGFTELHNPSPSNQGNRNLEPERAWAYELGSLSAITPKIRLKFKSYLRMERNVIDWIRPETDGETNTLPWNAQNLGKCNHRVLRSRHSTEIATTISIYRLRTASMTKAGNYPEALCQNMSSLNRSSSMTAGYNSHFSQK